MEEAIVAATLSPESILREMVDLWASLGKQGVTESGAGVLRSCTMTFVVLTEVEDDTAALGETIGSLMKEHPARTIVIRVSRGEERSLASRVFTQCWKPFGQRRQICCEHIEITASEGSLADVVSIIAPLIVPDLPVVVWCRSGRVLERAEFGALAATADKVVVDTAGWADAKAAIGRLGAVVAGGPMLADLSWTRLSQWRETLAQIFENPRNRERLPQISKVRVGYGGTTAPVSARYMGAWLVNGLKSVGARAELEFEPDGAGAPGELLWVKLSGDALLMELARGEERLVITIDALSHCTNLPAATDALLMRNELRIIRHDGVFEQVLASAEEL